MGEWVKALLESRHIKIASMARAMGIDEKSAASYWTSKVISDDVLMRMTNALGWDLIGKVRNEQARRMAPIAVTEPASSNEAREPAVPYQRRPAGSSDTGMVLMINLDEYEEQDQLRILRAIQQMPKRGHSRATGS